MINHDAFVSVVVIFPKDSNERHWTPGEVFMSDENDKPFAIVLAFDIASKTLRLSAQWDWINLIREAVSDDGASLVILADVN